MLSMQLQLQSSKAPEAMHSFARSVQIAALKRITIASITKMYQLKSNASTQQMTNVEATFITYVITRVTCQELREAKRKLMLHAVVN